MEKYLILLAYCDKQWPIITRLKNELIQIDLSSYEFRYVFATKTQQFYTAVEDLLKQVAKAFENHVQELSSYHKELLKRLSMQIPGIRPAFLSERNFLFLDKIRSFRHFYRHAYDCELLQAELEPLKEKILLNFDSLENDFLNFKTFIKSLC